MFSPTVLAPLRFDDDFWSDKTIMINYIIINFVLVVIPIERKHNYFF
jgi:hypothetical protein